MLSIGIVGIPIQLEKSHGILREFFVTGLTDSLRASAKGFIEENLKREEIQATIVDLGELISEKNYSSENDRLIGIPKTRLDELAQEFEERIKNVDFVVVFGGVHTGAYLLYHLPGRVERFDLHDDDDKLEVPFHTSYLRHASELKDSLQVLNHSWPDLLDGILDDEPVNEPPGKIFDIDVDYYTSTEYCKLTEERIKKHVQRIKSRIEKAKPKVIGFFEFQTLDGSSEGRERLLSLIWEGVKANITKIPGIHEKLKVV
jgi:hypothetical protein